VGTCAVLHGFGHSPFRGSYFDKGTRNLAWECQLLYLLRFTSGVLQRTSTDRSPGRPRDTGPTPRCNSSGRLRLQA